MCLTIKILPPHPRVTEVNELSVNVHQEAPVSGFVVVSLDFQNVAIFPSRY